MGGRTDTIYTNPLKLQFSDEEVLCDKKRKDLSFVKSVLTQNEFSRNIY